MTDGPLIVQSDKTVLLEIDHELARGADEAGEELMPASGQDHLPLLRIIRARCSRFPLCPTRDRFLVGRNCLRRRPAGR